MNLGGSMRFIWPLHLDYGAKFKNTSAKKHELYKITIVHSGEVQFISPVDNMLSCSTYFCTRYH